MNEPVVKYWSLEQRMLARVGDVAHEHRLARHRDPARDALPDRDARAVDDHPARFRAPTPGTAPRRPASRA